MAGASLVVFHPVRSMDLHISHTIKNSMKAFSMKSLGKRVGACTLAASALGAFTLVAALAGGCATKSSVASRGETRASTYVTDQVDWRAFLHRNDLVWDTLPSQFDDGAFLGNGLIGTTIYRDGTNNLIRFEIGRTDVTDHFKDNARVLIGALMLQPVGRIQSGTFRTDLWNAETRGVVTTDKGELKFRAIVHADTLALILDLETSGDETGATFSWREGKGGNSLYQIEGMPANPPSVTRNEYGVTVCIQPRGTGGQFATAWTETAVSKLRRVYLSVADSFPGNTAGTEAVKTVRSAASADFAKLLDSHRAWWHALYPKSFVSVPDRQLEQFYWVQIYKLASASRPDRGPVDLLGPWFRDSYWPRVWWNLNIETLYLPCYTANQLELGESFVRLLDDHRTNFVEQARLIWKCEDGAAVSHTTDNRGIRGTGTLAPDHYLNPGDFTWALHNYYLHYRHSMDHSMVTDPGKHAFYPLLRGAANVYFHIMQKGDDGKYHLPVLHSPEYGNCADSNYNLSLMRWALQTLIDLNDRYRLNDPLRPKWKDALDNLTPYPTDENGLCVGAGTPFAHGHRHWSHMLMVHPLHTLDFRDPKDGELLRKSIHHWIDLGTRNSSGDGIYGWSRAAAASLYAALGEGDNALDSVHRHMSDKRFVRQNTMYIEGCPVIECSIVLARSLQDMLLQSHNHLIRVFPAMPTTWNEAVFHDFRTEGAFLVSAQRANGKTQWVRVKSLAGEPCRIAPNLEGDVKATVPLKPLGDGAYELVLAKGAEALLYTGAKPHAAVRSIGSE